MPTSNTTTKIIICLLSLLTIKLSAQQPEIELQNFASGLDEPLDIQHAGDERLFIVSQLGTITIVETSGNQLSPHFLDISDRVILNGERGLLGLAFHPEYHENGYFYINYTRKPDGANVISRFEVDSSNPNWTDSTTESILMVIPQPFSNHNGGDILFGPDGYLYIAIGDGGSGGDPQNNAQNPQNLLGKMLRIDVDNGDPYSIPSDNPYVQDSSTEDEIWALGLRNHWRNSFDRLTGDLWISDVGQEEIEEINFQPANSQGGENYGWRCYEGTEPYNLTNCGQESDYVFPVFEYGHYGGGCSGSVTGGFVYRGALYNGLYGKYLAADYCKGDFYWVEQTDTGFTGDFITQFSPFQYSSFGEDQYGELYIASLGNGQIQKIAETSDCRPVAKVLNSDTIYVNDLELALNPLELKALYHPSLTYQWYKDGELINGATEHIHQITAVEESGHYSVLVTNPANDCEQHSDETVVIISIINAEQKISKNEAIHIYPNPARDYLIISSSSPVEEIQIYDLTGREIFSQTGNLQSKHNIDISNLASGVYLIKIRSGNTLISDRIGIVGD